ncbi:hypothetical protein SUDANB106_00583 [Streptomyces sp. enrichment culture]
MVRYIPPLSPVVDAVGGTGHDAQDRADLFAATDAVRVPVEYLAELFAAVDPVLSATTRGDRPMYLMLTAAPAPAPAPGLAPRWPPTSSTRATAFAVWPFTRLVHMLTAPLGYLTRPYIVYRSRGHAAGLACPRRGWERVR